MHPFRRPALVLALITALALQACGGSTADRLDSIRAGLASGEAKKVASAMVGLKSLLQKQPKLADARLLLGQHLLRTGNPAAAAVELQRAADLGLPPATVLPALARAMLFDGKAAQVVARFQSERLADPAAQAALMSTLAIAMAHQGDLDGANKRLAAVLGAAPQATPALLAQARLLGMQGRYADGLQLLEPLRQREPAQAELWSLRGELLSRQPGQNAAAQQAFVEALRLEPQSTHAMLSLIPLRLAAGDLDGAKATFQQLKALAPELIGTGIAEANIAYAGGEHHRARELFQALLKALPDHVVLLLSAGENELRLGSVQQAEAHFAKAVALAPNHDLARRQLALAQVRLGQAAKALVTLEPLLDQPDTPVEVLALAADAQRANGQAKAARQLYERIARLNPTDPRLRTAIALGSANPAEPDKVIGELRAIAASDQGDSADLALINLHVQRGQHDQALAALDVLERKRPKDAAVHQLRGQVLAGRHDATAARASFERALQLQPNHVPAIAALAALDVRAKDLASARKRFDAVLKAQPGNAAALLGLAEVLRLDGATPQRVSAQIEAAIQAAPQDPQARLQLIRHHLERNNTEAALNAARAATAALPDNLDLLDLQARCHMRLGQSQQALSSYGKMAQAAPRSARPHVGMADVHLATNDLDAAERSIARALQLSPELVEARAQAIALAMRRQQFDKAVDLARAVQKEQPEAGLGYTLEGEIELRRGRWAAAAGALQTAITKTAPGAAPMKLYQALKMDRRDADAERFAARWTAAHPQDIPFQLLLADSAQGAGQTDKAETLYRQVLKTQPDHAGALNNLAMLLAAQKKPEAVELAERAVRAAPDSATVLDTLATAQASIGELSDALASQRRAVALAPADPPLRLALARLLLQANKPALAKQELIKVIESASRPDDLDEAKRLLAALE